jgi:hypothetical protein
MSLWLGAGSERIAPLRALQLLGGRIGKVNDIAAVFAVQESREKDEANSLWEGLAHSRVLEILHNPRYAGVFAYGRTHIRKKIDGGKSCSKVPRDQWLVKTHRSGVAILVKCRG